eukprot:7072620-Prymnesium_polylepis.2
MPRPITVWVVHATASVGDVELRAARECWTALIVARPAGSVLAVGPEALHGRSNLRLKASRGGGEWKDEGRHRRHGSELPRAVEDYPGSSGPPSVHSPRVFPCTAVVP